MKGKVLFDACDAFLKTARKQEDLDVLKNNIGNYVHFSNSERFGLSYHKNIHPGNPRGIYGFPLTAEKYQKIVDGKPNAFYEYGSSKYIYVFNVTGIVLDMDRVDYKELLPRIKSLITKQYPKVNPDSIQANVMDGKGIQLLNLLANISKNVFKNEHSGANVLLRGLGFDAIETKNYGFGDDLASEIAVINPSAANLIVKLNNPMMTREQIKEIDWFNSPEYKAEQQAKELAREKAYQDKMNLNKLRNQEYEEVHNLERKYMQEKQFDKATQVIKDFHEKWK